MTLNPPAAQDKRLYGKAVIAIRDRYGYISPIYPADLESLDKEEQKQIKDFDVK